MADDAARVHRARGSLRCLSECLTGSRPTLASKVLTMRSVSLTIFEVFNTDVRILSKRTLPPFFLVCTHACVYCMCVHVCVCVYVCMYVCVWCAFVACTEKRILTLFENRDDAMPESSDLNL